MHAGQLFYIGYNLQRKPHCWFGALDRDGNVMFDCPVELPKGDALVAYWLLCPCCLAAGQRMLSACCTVLGKLMLISTRVKMPCPCTGTGELEADVACVQAS